MSDFLVNIVRRGAGLAAGVAPAPPQLGAVADIASSLSPVPAEPEGGPTSGGQGSSVTAPPVTFARALPRVLPPSPAPLEKTDLWRQEPTSSSRSPEAPHAAPSPSPSPSQVQVSPEGLAHPPEATAPAPAQPEPRSRPPVPESRVPPVSLAPNSSSSPEDGASPRAARPRAEPPAPAPGRLGTAHAASERTPETPRVQVRIGRVEIRVSKPAARPSPPPAPKAPAGSRGPRGFSEHSLARRYLDRRWY